MRLIEALANVIVGGVGMALSGYTPKLPLEMFALAGAAQVCSKVFTSYALAEQVSFPVVTLAKSGKMIPVMLGTLFFGGKMYSWKEYVSVAMIIGGTTLVSLGKKSVKMTPSSYAGLMFIVSSLTCDGIVGGIQNRLIDKCKEAKVVPKQYDFMFWTNLFMMLTAAILALFVGDFQTGIAFCVANPSIFRSIVMFSACSAVGQSFIFFTILNFDSLFCATVTTTRKIVSVLLSIFMNGHSLSPSGWTGLSIACAGILAELWKETSKNREASATSTSQEDNTNPSDSNASKHSKLS